ncbi:MAG TPA: hypothetical protein PLB97_09770 [Accumulibacter sp.]|nr:hypothetical protein [Accumulibacter sp.]HPP46229.1 hypothetical protein [Accumulibacter sp.]
MGANGTGKTHLLKVLYAACAVTVGEDIRLRCESSANKAQTKGQVLFCYIAKLWI